MASSYLCELEADHPELVTCRATIEEAFSRLRACYGGGGKVLLCGNGGSAADAEHWSGEMLKGFALRRPLPAEWREKLSPDLGDRLQQALPALPLTGFLSAATAFANDVDPEYVYAQLTWALGNTGDVLVGISTSGNARNVCHAVDVANAKGMTTIGLTGRSGGRLAESANVTIRVPEDRTHRVQELHLPVYHTLCLMLEEAFFGAEHADS